MQLWPMVLNHIPAVQPVQSASPQPVNKKKRLLSTVQDILNTTDMDIFRKRQIIEAQDNAFDEYENQLNIFKNKLMQEEQKNQSQGRHVSRLYSQINQKSILLNKKNKELSYHLGIINTLRVEIDGYQLRVIEAESQNEENIKHYKKIIASLTKEKSIEDKSSDYISYMRQVLKAFDNDEPIESLTQSDSVCVICLQKPSKILCYPCCHLEFCCECAGLYIGKDELYFKENNNIEFKGEEKFQCTRCKSDIDNLHYVFK